MAKSDDLLKRYATLEGVLDAILSLREATDALEGWDTQLGVSGKAKRLAIVDANLRNLEARHDLKKLTAARRARREALQAFNSATNGPDLWGARLYVAAGDLVRDLGITVGDPVFSGLAFRLVDRFVRMKAAGGGRPLPEPPSPNFSPPIGQRFVIDERAPAWFVKRYQLPQLIADVRKALRAVEKAAAKAGKPADVNVCRRNGDWYFHVATKRTKAEQIGAWYHEERGSEHTKEHGEGVCDLCTRHVNRSVASARKSIGPLVKDA